MFKYIKSHIKINNFGFTVMELVVVLGVFSISSLIITEIFMTINKTQRRIVEHQKIQSDISYTLEVIARAVRLGSIDYSYYSDAVNNPETSLYLKDAEERQTVFIKGLNQADKCVDDQSSPCIISGFDLDADGAIEDSEKASITPKGIKISDLKFYINPIIDPFLYTLCAAETQIEDCLSDVCMPSGFCQIPNKQPIVSISISATDVSGANPITMTLQTTVSSREYYR
ncbi:MAG: hypothetical protein V1891_02370 [bacterium]